MTLLRTLTFLFLCTAIVQSVHSAPLTDATLKTLLSVSGTDAKVKHKTNELIEVADLTLENAKGNKAAEDVLKAFKKPSFLSDGVKKSFKELVTEEQAKSLIAWYQTPLGKKVADAEKQAASAEAIKQVRQLGEKLVLDNEKVKAGTKIILAANTLFSSAQIDRAVAKALLIVNFAINKPDTKKTEEVIDTLVNEETINTAKVKAHQVQLLTLYTYQDFSLQEIEEYVEQLQTIEMKTLNTALPNGIVAVIENESKPLLK